MNTAPIANPTVTIVASETLVNYIRNLEISVEIPNGIKAIRSEDPLTTKRKLIDHKLLFTDADRHFLQNLNLPTNQEAHSTNITDEKTAASDYLLNLEDLYWLYDAISENNKSASHKIYLHELLKNCTVNLPKNIEVPRSQELEKRCQRLKAQQQNREYNKMTKNVDSIRKKYPEDTIAYQLKQMNTHLIAVFQFIISVVAGFAFGFIGIELIVGNLDFGFRLLLGIICSLVIALAELYFLAKKLNEDLNFEFHSAPSISTKKTN